jgi:hypothetical protein
MDIKVITDKNVREEVNGHKNKGYNTTTNRVI